MDILIPQFENHKTNYFNLNGGLVLETDYRMGRLMFNGYSVVTGQNSRLGICDSFGNLVVPTIYNGILGSVNKSGYVVALKESRQCGIISIAGDELVFGVYNKIRRLHQEGFAVFKSKNGSGVIRLADLNEVIPKKYKYISFQYVPLLGGLVAVCKAESGQRIEVINLKTGKLEVAISNYELLRPQSNGLFLENAQGLFFFDYVSFRQLNSDIERISVVGGGDDEWVGVKIAGQRYGFVDIQSQEIVIDPVWDDVDYFEAGVAVVKKDGKYGAIDKSGSILVDCIYDDLTNNAKFGFFKIELGREFGYLNSIGKRIEFEN